MENDNTLFWDLLEKEYEMIKAYCYKLTDNIVNGDDLLQNSILKAQEHFGDLRQTDKFRFWLYKIIGNSYKASFRTPWWKKVLPLSEEIENNFQTTNPSSYYDAKRKLQIAFEVLSPDEHVLITLFELEGWKIGEISNMTGKSEGSVKMSLTRARAKMRKRLSRLIQQIPNRQNSKKARELCFASKPEKD